MKEEREGPKIGAVEEPKIEAVEDEPKIEAEEGPAIAGGEEPEPAAEAPLELGADGEAEPQQDREDVAEDRLELDRMEVRPTPGKEEGQEEGGEAEEVILEMPQRKEPARPNILAMLADHWIWIVACLLGLSAVSAVLLFVLMPEGGTPDEMKRGKRVHVVSASLGGEYYVRFNLWGPFREPEGQAVLRESMPKIRHDLILSGGRPEVARAIQENDLYFLEKHILGIVSRETGIPMGELDLKGLSVTRYSDEAEVAGEG